MAPSSREVVVVGAGAAGLAAAIAAREAGAAVTLLEAAEPERAGGNTVFSGGLLLLVHAGLDDLRPLLAQAPEGAVEAAAYTREDFAGVLHGMSDGRADDGLVAAVVDGSLPTVRWLAAAGVPLQFNRFGTYVVDGTVHVPHGPALSVVDDGRGLVQALTRRAQAAGVRLRYGARFEEVEQRAGAVTGVRLTTAAGEEALPCGAVVLAGGGFQGSRELRRRYLGERWESVRVRGSAFNTGQTLVAGLRAGAGQGGDWSLCHSAGVDAATPTPDRVGDLTPQSLRAFFLGVMVNREGRRFVDEGPGLWINFYSKMGRAILDQPGAEAIQVYDQQTAALVRELQPDGAAVVADTIEELAEAFDLPPAALAATVADFGRATAPGAFDPRRLDGLHTAAGLAPRKSNWAVPLDTPPFVGYRAVCGVTFTYGGLQIDADARVMGDDRDPIAGLYAAGDVTGGLFFSGYPGGAALTRAIGLGLSAGRGAAALVQQA